MLKQLKTDYMAISTFQNKIKSMTLMFFRLEGDQPRGV